MDPKKLDQNQHLLSSFQKEIYDECLLKRSGGLSVPMGSGKTLLSLIIALNQAKPDQKILVVASKSLISVWDLEIKKFLPDLPYEILYKTHVKDITIWKPESKVILTTPQMIIKAYDQYEIRSNIISYVSDRTKTPPEVIKYYSPSKQPFLNHSAGIGLLYSLRWGVLVVDEIQQYTNVETKICQGLISICSDYKWLLSGTIVQEPTPKRVLGYYLILNYPNTPRCLPDTENYVRNEPMKNIRGDLIDKFKGLSLSMVRREENKMFVPPKINKKIVSHSLNQHEHQIYLLMKAILLEVAKKAKELKNIDQELARKFSTYKLAMLTYLRQSLICPFVPLASAAVDMLDFKEKSLLSEICMNKIKELNLTEWMNDENSVKTTRIQQILKSIEEYKSERIVVFMCFRTCLNILKYYIKDREIYELTSQMNIKKRGEMIQQFEQSKNGVLLLTYDLGANGLNLQCANTMLLADFWWNAGKTEQAIARIFRFGQKAKVVNVVYFTSNTALEQIIFNKQKMKLDVINELMTGSVVTKIKNIKINEIIKFISMEENQKLLENIYF